MSNSADDLVRDVLRSLAYGEITPKEAAGIFIAHRVKDLSSYVREFSAIEAERLHEVFPAIEWEFLKHDAPGMAEVEYGSPAHLAWEEANGGER